MTEINNGKWNLMLKYEKSWDWSKVKETKWEL